MSLDQYSEDSEDDVQTEFEAESFEALHGPRWLSPLWKVMFFFGIPPLQGVIFLLVAGVLGGTLFYYGLQPLTRNATATDPQPEAPREISVDEQISQLGFSNPSRSHRVIAAEIVALRERISQVSGRSDLSAQQRSKLALTTLQNEQILIESQLREEKCSDEDLNSFETLVKSYISEDDESMSELAYYALARVRTLKFRNEPTESYGDHLVLGYSEFSLGFENDVKRISFLLEQLLKAKKQNPKNKSIVHVIASLGRSISESKNASAKQLADAIVIDSRFFGLQIRKLNEDIRNREHGSLQNFGDVLKEVEKDPKIDFLKWTTILKSCDSLLSIGEHEKFEIAHDSISEMLGRLPDSWETKSTFTKQIKQQKKRFELLGTSVELAKESISGREIDSNNRNVLLVFLDSTPASSKLISELNGQAFDTYQPILIFNNDLSEKDRQLVNFLPLGIEVASFDAGSKLIQSCFIDQYPYTIAVDKQRTIVGINLPLWQAAIANTFETTK